MSQELKPASEHPDFGKICGHGQLKRQCYTCELEDKIDLQKEVIDKLLDSLNSLRDTENDFSTIHKTINEAVSFAKEKLV